MPRTIILDRGMQHIRLMECEVRGDRVVVRGLNRLAAPDSPEGGSPETVQKLVLEALASHAERGARIYGLIGRSHAVLRDLRLPDVPAEEMPGMVQLQAMRELSFPVEQAAIDYEVVGPPDAEGQRRVILAALQNEVIDRFRNAISGSQLELVRVGLRPYATWRAYRQAARMDGAVLVVSLDGESLELTVGRGESVLFSRATLLRGSHETGTSAPDISPALVSEVRRTLAAFSNQVPGVEVQRVVLAAGSDESQKLLEALAAGLTVPVDRLDPFKLVELSGEASRMLRDSGYSPGAFVAAVGAAISLDEPWPIDFLCPKRPVVRRDRRKPAAMLAAAAIALVVAGSYLVVQLQLAAGRETIRQLTKQSTDLQEKLKDASEIVRKHQAVEQWLSASVNCLSELHRLSEEFPDTKDMHSTSIRIERDRTPSAPSRIVLDGVARQQVAISEFNTKLNSGQKYTAQPVGQVQQDKRSGDYRWSFKTSITVTPTEGVEASKPAATAAAAGPATSSKRPGSAGPNSPAKRSDSVSKSAEKRAR